jgi:transposase-like protein
MVDCERCDRKMTFYDGAFKHEPKFVCGDCGREILAKDLEE